MKTLMYAGLTMVISFFSLGAMAQAGQLKFYEGTSGTQDVVVLITDAPGQYFDLKEELPYDVGANDEASSLELINVRAGATISVYDSSDGTPSDDYTVIYVKQFFPSYIVFHFEGSWEDEWVKVTHFHKNGLNGKVSAIRVN